MNVERIIRNVIVAILREQPFYGHIISQLPKVYTNKIPTLAVGKASSEGLLINLYINPDYVEQIYSQTSREQAFNHFVEVVKHEILHIVFQHLYIKKPDTERQKIAMELSVNSYINTQNLVCKGIYPEDYNFPSKLGFEEYYKLLPQSPLAPEENQYLDSHDLWNNLDEKESSKLLLKDIIKKAAEAAQNTSQWGNLPSEIREQIGSFLEQKEEMIPWQTVLKNFVSSSSESILGYTNKRISRRYKTRPGTFKEETLNLAIGIDTSGSVDLRTIETFFNELYWISRNNVEITVFECDCKIRKEYPFKHWQGNEISGRGGTDLEPVFKEAAKRRFDALIYFTDGEAPTITTDYNIPTVFVISGRSYHKNRETLPYKADIVFRAYNESNIEIW